MFEDRRDAGRRLAGRLGHLAGRAPLVLGLPRGGVVVASEIARALGAPLDVLVARKLGAPGQPELALGAVLDGDPPQRVLNEDLVRALRVPSAYIERTAERELAEARRRLDVYRCGRPAIGLAGRTVILVDDGVATGATIRASLTVLGRCGLDRLVLAVPVGAPDVLAELEKMADELVCLEAPRALRSVGSCYERFDQTSDSEVVGLLAEADGHGV